MSFIAKNAWSVCLHQTFTSNYLDNTIRICNFAHRNVDIMAKTEYITIKNASRKVLLRMRQIGIDKAQRLQEAQKRWDDGEYKNSDIVQL